MAQGFSYGVFLALVYGVARRAARCSACWSGAGLASLVGFAGHKLFAFRPAPRPAQADASNSMPHEPRDGQAVNRGQPGTMS